jgi:hypothetical protein
MIEPSPSTTAWHSVFPVAEVLPTSHVSPWSRLTMIVEKFWSLASRP